jgi:hypothetical protein
MDIARLELAPQDKNPVITPLSATIATRLPESRIVGSPQSLLNVYNCYPYNIYPESVRMVGFEPTASSFQS